MSELETSMPTRAEILSVIGGLEALCPTPATSVPAAVPSPPPNSLDAAQARHDQDTAALRDLTADRDAWRSAAERLQTELWRQMDVVRSELDGERAVRGALGAHVEAQRIHAEAMRCELETLRGDRDGMGIELLQHREQIAHLSAAIASLLEIANSRATSSPPVPPTAPESPDSVGYAMPAGMEGRPSTQPPPPPVDPNAAPMIIPSLAPDPPPPVKRRPIRAVQTTESRTPVAPVERRLHAG